MSMCMSQVLTWTRKGVLALMELELQVFVSPLLWVVRSEIHTTEKAVSILLSHLFSPIKYTSKLV